MKAYEDMRFLESKDGRALRILAEYLEPLSRFQKEKIHDTIVFFGSARFQGDAAAKKNFTAVERNEAKAPAQQHAANLKTASAAVDMARYWGDWLGRAAEPRAGFVGPPVHQQAHRSFS